MLALHVTAQRGSQGDRLRCRPQTVISGLKAREPMSARTLPIHYLLEIRCKCLFRELNAQVLFWQLKRLHFDVLSVEKADTISALSSDQNALVRRVGRS